MNLMRDIRAFPVEKGSVALWWLGQNSFLFKSPEGTLAGVDLYLTDSCAALGHAAGINLSRAVPILIQPEELDIDLFTCTHNHQDHTDPETIRNLRNKDVFTFLGPHPSCDVFRQQGVESGRIQAAWPQCEFEFRDLKLRGTFALPTDTTDLNHMGFLLQFGNGPKIYITGDTDYTELLHEAAAHKPDLLITCINGGFNNLSFWEAAQLAEAVKPKAAVPCHYDMFPDNSVNPRMFEAAMKLRCPDVRYAQPEHGKPFVFDIG
jgi:L-ascorbate 6-phosphate lactonase